MVLTDIPDTWEGTPKHQVPIYRERPNCRKVINKLISEGKHLGEIASSFRYSDGIRKQARKMLHEREI